MSNGTDTALCRLTLRMASLAVGQRLTKRHSRITTKSESPPSHPLFLSSSYTPATGGAHLLSSAAPARRGDTNSTRAAQVLNSVDRHCWRCIRTLTRGSTVKVGAAILGIRDLRTSRHVMYGMTVAC